MSATAHDQIVDGPTEGTPETGDICIRGVVISTVDHWVAEDLHVFRSTEFDLIVEHEDEWEAVRIFLDSARDLAFYFADLIQERQATQHEVETANLLLPRFLKAAEESERSLRAAQRRILNIPRRHDRDSESGWHRRSTPSSSSRPLPV